MTCSRLSQLLLVATLCSIFAVPAIAARKGGGGGKSRAAAKAPRSSGNVRRTTGRNGNSGRSMKSPPTLKSQPNQARSYSQGGIQARPQFNQPTKPRLQQSAVRKPRTIGGQTQTRPPRDPRGNRPTIVPENRNQGRRFSNATPPKPVRKLNSVKQKAVADRIRNSSQPRRAAGMLKDKLQSRGPSATDSARQNRFEPGPAPDARPVRDLTTDLTTRVRDFDATSLDSLTGDKVNDYIESHRPNSETGPQDSDDPGGIDPNDFPDLPHGDPTNEIPHGDPTDDYPPGDPTDEHPPGDNPPPPHNDCPENNGGGHTHGGGHAHGGGHGTWRFPRPVFIGFGTAGRLAVRPCDAYGTTCTTGCETGVCNDVAYGGDSIVQGDTIVGQPIAQGETIVDQAISSFGVVTDDEPEYVAGELAANDEPVTIYEGQTMGLPTADLGTQAGTVTLTISGIMFKVEVLEWNARDMMFRVPELGLTQSIDGTLSIAMATGEQYETIPVMLVPGEKASKQLAEAVVGSEMTVNGVELGPTTGRIGLELASNLKLPVKVVSWSTDEVRITIPDLSLAEAREGGLAVFSASGELVDRIALRVLPR